jgi:hypothetical protein
MNILPIIENQSKTKENAIQGKTTRQIESITPETTFCPYLALQGSCSITK